MDHHQFQRPETPPPSYDAATNGEKYQKCGSCLLLGKCLDVKCGRGPWILVCFCLLILNILKRGWNTGYQGSRIGVEEVQQVSLMTVTTSVQMMTIKCFEFSSARIIRIIDRLLGLSARMGKGRSWLGSDQDCLRACTNIQFVKYWQSVHKICIRSKNIQFVKRFSFRIVSLRIYFGLIVTIEQISTKSW